MANNVVTVFNQLTQSELADPSLFEDVLNNHYEKFKLFYYITCDMSISDVTKIQCKCKSGGLAINVDFDKKKNRDSFFEKFNESLANASDSRMEIFEVTISDAKKTLNISIENKTISREDEIYADRPDTN